MRAVFSVLLTLFVGAFITNEASAAFKPGPIHTTYYVDRRAPSGGDGAMTNPFRKIQHAADLVQPGDIVLIAAGKYREAIVPNSAGTETYPITFERWDVRPGTVDILGSVRIRQSQWFLDSGTTYRWNWNPPAAADPELNENDYFSFYVGTGNAGDIGVFRREIFPARNPASRDWEPLRPVYAKNDLRPGTFYLETAGECELGETPNHPDCTPVYVLARFWDDRNVSYARPELGVRDILFKGVGSMDLSSQAGGGYILRNLRFRFANNSAQQGEICLNWVSGVRCKLDNNPGGGSTDAQNLGSDGIVEDVTVQWTNGVGIDVSGLRHTFRRVKGLSNGQMGWGGACDHCLIVDGAMSYNDWKYYPSGWEAGGAKFVFMHGTTIPRMRASTNAGPGIWLDIWNENNVIEGCLTDANDTAGIFIEYNSSSNLIQHNISTFTWTTNGDTGAGILEQSAYGNFYYHNSVFNNRIQGTFLRDDWGVTSNIPGYSGHNAHVHNNLLVGNGIESIFTPGVGAPANGGREMQVEDRCQLGQEGDQDEFSERERVFIA